MIRYIVFAVLLLVSSSFIPSYQFYQTNITLSRVKAKSYGNFKLFASNLWGASEQTSLSVSINKVIQFYNNKPHPFRWQSEYSIQYFQDSTMSTIAQILYRKVNLTHTYRYYSIRPRRGLLANKTFFLGSDTCQSCNPGRDMHLMSYKSVDIQSQQNLAFDFVNIVNSVKKMSWNVEDIKEVRLWEFPEGSFYIPVFQYANESTYMAAILSTPSQALTFIEGVFFPKVKGNVLIDELYLYEYLYLIYDDRNLKLPAQLNSNIINFEYYVDPVDRQATTIMLNVLNSRTYYQFFGVFQQKAFNLISTAQFNKAEQVPYLTEQYFLQNTENNRMSSTITADEYRQFAKQDPTRLSSAKILQAKYIDFPNGMRQYMLTISYNQESTDRVSLRYFLRPNIPKFTLSKQVYNRVIIFNSASPYPWEQTWPKLYEYKREYGLIHDIERYSYTINGIGATQICNLFEGHFEGNVWNVNKISNFPKLKRLFLKDLETNRIFLVLESPLTNAQEKGGPNFSFCPLVKIEIVDSSTFERVFSALTGQLVNVNGEAFAVEELKEQLVFRLNTFGGYNFYYLSFEKNGVKSAFYIDETKKGVLTIVNYVDNVEESGLNNYPSLGSANPKTPHNPATNTTKTNTTKTNTTTTNSTNNSNSSSPPKPQITPPTINDIFISGDGSLSAQDVVNHYPTLINIIKNYDTSPNLQKKPIVFVYSDRYNKVALYAMAFSYSANVYEVFQLIEMVESKKFYFSGKNYLTNLPSVYWNISDSSNQEVMQQAIALVNSNSAVANVPILKGTVQSIPTLKGGIFFVNMTVTNGYIVNIAFLRKQIVWEKLYAYFLPPTGFNPTGNNNPDPNNPNPNNLPPNPNGPTPNTKPTLTNMTDSQIRSDTSLLTGFNLIKDSITQLMTGLGLSQAMRGSFSNGTWVYNLTYRSQNSPAYLNIIFYYDPVSCKVLYLKTDPEKQITPVPAILNSPSDQEMQKIVMDNTLASYPQLSGYQSASIQWSKFPTFWVCNVNLTVNGVIYYRIVQVSIPSMLILELKFAKGGV